MSNKPPQTILITGASEGIGLEIARRAIAGGARTILVARDRQKLEAAAANISGAHRPEMPSSISPTRPHLRHSAMARSPMPK